mmetsp:Transcript_96563/g.268396  ORF Transcript_96563/g.268396 Transcript_96563/m.268396 type:complete len:406 (-) Transcript_96563:109-1326(-)
MCPLQLVLLVLLLLGPVPAMHAPWTPWNPLRWTTSGATSSATLRWNVEVPDPRSLWHMPPCSRTCRLALPRPLVHHQWAGLHEPPACGPLRCRLVKRLCMALAWARCCAGRPHSGCVQSSRLPAMCLRMCRRKGRPWARWCPCVVSRPGSGRKAPRVGAGCSQSWQRLFAALCRAHRASAQTSARSASWMKTETQSSFGWWRCLKDTLVQSSRPRRVGRHRAVFRACELRTLGAHCASSWSQALKPYRSTHLKMLWLAGTSPVRLNWRMLPVCCRLNSTTTCCTSRMSTSPGGQRTERAPQTRTCISISWEVLPCMHCIGVLTNQPKAFLSHLASWRVSFMVGKTRRQSAWWPTPCVALMLPTWHSWMLSVETMVRPNLLLPQMFARHILTFVEECLQLVRVTTL